MVSIAGVKRSRGPKLNMLVVMPSLMNMMTFLALRSLASGRTVHSAVVFLVGIAIVGLLGAVDGRVHLDAQVEELAGQEVALGGGRRQPSDGHVLRRWNVCAETAGRAARTAATATALSWPSMLLNSGDARRVDCVRRLAGEGDGGPSL